MKFGSVCSGIEAASVAWNPLGWKAAWFSEIEPFPCAVLAHHYPDTPNFGDMTKFESWPNDEQHAIDLLCGGTPCQSFSVAGLRKGLDDPRGDLMLTFGSIAAKYRPKWLVWENVPGVLSSNGGRDFGCFLGMLGKLGYGFAYRVLDAQYFGVAQRRRRVFVVGCIGDWRSAAAVLFERYSLSGHPAPRRKTGEGVAPTIRAGAANGGAGHGARSGDSKDELITPVVIDRAAFNAGENAKFNATIEQSETMATIISRGPHAVMMLAHGQGGAEIGFDRAPALTCNHEAVILAFDSTQVTNPTNSSNPKYGDPCHTLNAKAHAPSITYGIPGNWIGRKPENGGNAVEPMHDVAPCQTKTDVHAVVVHGTQDPCVSDVAFAQGRNNGAENALISNMQVRRLTPTECERLQGFPDSYTNVPHRGKPAADGPRYKALGNSWAVPCVRWIGERIQAVEGITA